MSVSTSTHQGSLSLPSGCVVDDTLRPGAETQSSPGMPALRSRNPSRLLDRRLSDLFGLRRCRNRSEHVAQGTTTLVVAVTDEEEFANEQMAHCLLHRLD